MATPPPLAVPPLARARALGALIAPRDHAIAYAAQEGEGLLAGFALEGMEAGERVLILTGCSSPRAVAARLRTHGVGLHGDRPEALRIVDAARLPSLREALDAAWDEAEDDGFSGLRAAHQCSAGRLALTRGEEQALPRRFRDDITLLCVYGRDNLGRMDAERAWALARAHGRILYV
jgi:hypothetical protein